MQLADLRPGHQSAKRSPVRWPMLAAVAAVAALVLVARVVLGRRAAGHAGDAAELGPQGPAFDPALVDGGRTATTAS